MMHCKHFSTNQMEYDKLISIIDEFLSTRFDVDFTQYIKVAQTENLPVAKAIKIKYKDFGWDIEIKEECIDYHDCQYIQSIFFKIGSHE
jgi:hypothetical protein